MLKEGDNIGKCLVEGIYIRIGGLIKTWVDAIQQGMRHLMGDDVVG